MDERIFKELDALKALIVELVKQGAAHNEMLRTHEARSLALQAELTKVELRVKPVETHVALLNTIGKWCLLVGAPVLTAALVKFLIS